MAETEIIIVGAGAAGIAAARSLAARGRRCVVLEAGARIGGRALTSEALGAPLDLGATWLHAARRNPLVRHAHQAFDHDAVRARHLHLGERWANAAELAELAQAEDRYDAALEHFAGQPDRSVAEVVPQGGRWDATVRHWQGAQIQAMEVERLSAQDQRDNVLEGPNLLLPRGIGTLVAALGEGLPIHLRSPVQRLEWSGPDAAGPNAAGHVVAEGPFGRLRAQRAIITVSTGVLAAGAINFVPALPAPLVQAIAGLPMALLTKFAFRCRRGGEIPPFHTIRAMVSAALPRPMSFTLWPFGRDQLFGFVGGSRAWELAAAGADATLDAAAAELRGLLGSLPLGPAMVSDWGTDPLFRGSYSQAMPGAAGARAVLRQPLGPLLFAGEATALGLAGTVGGAWAEGERVAALV